jgi:hypothetical protein
MERETPGCHRRHRSPAWYDVIVDLVIRKESMKSMSAYSFICHTDLMKIVVVGEIVGAPEWGRKGVECFNIYRVFLTVGNM